MKNPSKYTLKMIDWVLYQGTEKPSKSISDARWAAMVKHILREYVSSLRKKTKNFADEETS